MKKIMLILLAAVAMLSAGCSKEKENEAIDNGGYSYSVSIGDWTRVVNPNASKVLGVTYKMRVGEIRQVSVTPKGSSPEPESISVKLSSIDGIGCLSWDSEKKTVKAEEQGYVAIKVNFKVLNSEINAEFLVVIYDY